MFPIELSTYYQRWLEEKAEIERNKWFLSEHVGHDVGWEYAQWDWIMRHRAAWLQHKRQQGQP